MNRKSIFLSLFFLAFLFLYAQESGALEQKIQDLTASVEVVPVFSLSLDNPNLSFGMIGPGQTKTLGEGYYFNEVKCRSNSGRNWYLKMQLTSLQLLGKEYHLSTPSLKWKVIGNTGSAEPVGKMRFEDFSAQPILLYASLGDDNKGKEVALKFQYQLALSADAPAGTYVGQIMFTLAESP